MTPGSEAQPWKSLGFALQRLRVLRPHPGPENAVTIHMRGGLYTLTERITMQGIRDSFITVTNYQQEEVTISGAVSLDLDWRQEGDVLHGSYAGECGEMYLEDFRMIKARGPNIANYGVNSHFGTGPYHKVSGFLVETDDCRVDSDKFSQNCPDQNRNGFYLRDEMSPDWQDLDQAQILIFHSWINEFTRYRLEYTLLSDDTAQGGQRYQGRREDQGDVPGAPGSRSCRSVDCVRRPQVPRGQQHGGAGPAGGVRLSPGEERGQEEPFK